MTSTYVVSWSRNQDWSHLESSQARARVKLELTRAFLELCRTHFGSSRAWQEVVRAFLSSVSPSLLPWSLRCLFESRMSITRVTCLSGSHKDFTANSTNYTRVKARQHYINLPPGQTEHFSPEFSTHHHLYYCVKSIIYSRWYFALT